MVKSELGHKTRSLGNHQLALTADLVADPEELKSFILQFSVNDDHIEIQAQ